MAAITVKVNGKIHSVEVDENTPLLWVLRDNLGLTGTKYGCGKAQCGACTVHFNGIPVRSCSIPIHRVGEADVMTIEGVASQDEEAPIFDAWKKLNVPQCGFCQVGQLMSAIALLNNNDDPSDEDINLAMSGNICRCGTYTRIRKAIKLAANRR